MIQITPSQLHTILRTGVVQVEFTKVDGTNRVMNCTLSDGWIPEATGQLIAETGAAHFSVWDIDAGGWRSFRLESVKSVKVPGGAEYIPTKSTLLG